jgi:hypothetical protein
LLFACTQSISLSLKLFYDTIYAAAGLLLLLQHGLLAVSARGLLDTFAPVPPAKIAMQAFQLEPPKPNVMPRAAPVAVLWGQQPTLQPNTQPAAASPAPSNMRMAAPATAEVADIPIAPSVPFNPSIMATNQLIAQQLAQAGPVDTSKIPESHPVGMEPAAAAAMPRPTGFAGLLSTGAQTLSALQKVWKQVSGTDSADGADAAVAGAQPSSSDYSSSDYSWPQGQQGSVGVASLNAKPSAAAWSNSMLAADTAAVQPAVRAVPKDFMPMPAAVSVASSRQQNAAGRSGGRKVSVASVDRMGGNTPAAAAGVSAGLQQHISSYQQPHPAVVGSSVQVASAAGSKASAASSSSSDMSIDDISDATGAPVAQLSFQPATRMHVPYAPAARIVNAAPVSPSLLQNAMPPVAVAATVNPGAVSHIQTPTWVPSA